MGLKSRPKSSLDDREKLKSSEQELDRTVFLKREGDRIA